MGLFHVNIIALFAAAIVRMAMGAVWYAPAAWGVRWQRLNKLSDQEVRSQHMLQSIGVDFLTSLVTAYVLGQATHLAGVTDFTGGIIVGFYAWIFFATMTFGRDRYARRPIPLFLINAGFAFFELLAMAAILAAWG